jgi:UDP-N-acetylglucosamine:LPS N-acetylglucosamine transferase
VVVVYSRVGGGHLSAARALAEELESTGRATAKIVDAYVEYGRFPVTAFPAAYARLARYHPRLWSMVYHGSNSRLDASFVLRPFLPAGFKRLMAEQRPDLVVSVLPSINRLLGKAAARVGARFEVVITDWYALHRLWVARGVDHYTAPTRSALEDCVRFGADPASVEVVGIPVRRVFATPGGGAGRVRREPVLTALGLDPTRFTILAMVGAEGSPQALKSIACLAQASMDAATPSQLVVICGRNEKLRQHVQQLPSRMPLRALGFVDNVADLMRTADVLVTKAGGLTLAEAFCSDVPVVVYDVLPGQEAGNLAYALRHEAVAWARGPSELTRLIADLQGDPARRAGLAERGARLARPSAAQTIADGLLRRLDGQG